MTINETILKGKWLEIKGDINSISGLVIQKYGEQTEKFQSQLSAIIDKYSDKKENVVEQIKTELKS